VERSLARIVNVVTSQSQHRGTLSLDRGVAAQAADMEAEVDTDSDRSEGSIDTVERLHARDVNDDRQRSQRDHRLSRRGTRNSDVDLDRDAEHSHAAVMAATDRWRCKMQLSDYLQLSVLGRGSSAVVYRSFDKANVRLVALKAISILEQPKRRQLMRELRVLTSPAVMASPFVVEFHGKCSPCHGQYTCVQ